MAAAKRKKVAGVFARRRRAVMRTARRQKVDAVLVSQIEDVGYLCPFAGEDSDLVIGEDWACLITDGRYAEQAEGECGDMEVHVRKGAMSVAVAEVLQGRRVRRLGVQAGSVTLQTHDALAGKLPGKRLKPLQDLTADLRAIKTDAEVRAIRKAALVAEQAFRELLAMGAGQWVGATERDLAAELEYRMRRAGADGAAFPTIVAAGVHGSRPHHHPGATRVRSGEPVLIDWGARVGGYCSDLTRVVFLGRIPPKLGEVYGVVHRAQAAGIEAARPGVACKTVDAAARRVIAEAGYGEQFVHGLGHGVGRQVHESPGLGRTATGRLRSGMVVTVEPGIYLPGVGGVRIEDDVLVTPMGRRRLTGLPSNIDAMIL